MTGIRSDNSSMIDDRRGTRKYSRAMAQKESPANRTPDYYKRLADAKKKSMEKKK